MTGSILGAYLEYLEASMVIAGFIGGFINGFIIGYILGHIIGSILAKLYCSKVTIRFEDTFTDIILMRGPLGAT